ncbi:MAG: hypothetical protein RI925_1262 [Pseudomonadota bacterium]
MLMVISPAKTLDYDTPPGIDHHTTPDYLDRSAELIAQLATLSPAEIAQLMHISDPLAVLNAGRFASWAVDCSPDNAKQAVLAFMGDVYTGLNAAELSHAQLDWLQQHLRILSGLYGLLRPLDLMRPYRLEMGTKLANRAGKDLYAFWGDSLTEALNALLAEHDSRVLVNLASDEYFKAIRPKKLAVPVVTPVFQDLKNGQYKIISFYAKRARGLMVRYAALHGIDRPEGLRDFDLDGYQLVSAGSDAETLLFRRDHAE